MTDPEQTGNTTWSGCQASDVDGSGKTALITGVTGQDGAYLAELLLAKGYRVHGVKRRTSAFNTARIEHLYQEPHAPDRRLVLHHGDVTDALRMTALIGEIRPDEIYNLAAQSHVQVSFEQPAYTGNADALGCVNLLEALRLLGLERSTRFYQASTSEMFGGAETAPQSEATPFRPRSPYAAAKLYAHWATVNYREAYGLHASNGILFNHESPLRGETFVTRKITRAAAAIRLGLQERLYLGDLNCRRDWGHAREYVRGMWLMLQQPQGDDYVLATGRSATVRDFATLAFEAVGLPLLFEGEGAQERGRCRRTGRVVVEVDPRYVRPAETCALVGDASKARRVLGWTAQTTWETLCAEMVLEDLTALAADRRRRVA